MNTFKDFKKGTAASAAAPVVMFPPVKGAVPVVTEYRVTGDHANARFTIYSGGKVANVKVSASAQTVLGVTSTTGFTAGDVVMLYRPSTGASYWHTIDTVQTGVSLTLLANVGILTALGDQVYRMDVVAVMPCGSATVINAGGPNGITTGNMNMPLAGAVITGTSANVILMFAAAYIGV